MLAQGDKIQKCYYFDKGYCKYGVQCNLFHPSENCVTKCREKKCLKRHKINCRNQLNCKFQINNVCEFSHEPEEVKTVKNITTQTTTIEPKCVKCEHNDSVINEYKDKNLNNIETIKQKNTEIKELEDKINTLNILLNLKNMNKEPIKLRNELECNQCDFKANKKSNLHIHMKMYHENIEN